MANIRMLEERTVRRGIFLGNDVSGFIFGVSVIRDRYTGELKSLLFSAAFSSLAKLPRSLEAEQFSQSRFITKRHAD